MPERSSILKALPLPASPSPERRPAEGGRGFLPAAGRRFHAQGSGARQGACSAAGRGGACREGRGGAAPWAHGHQVAEALAQSGEAVGDGSAAAADPDGRPVPGQVWGGTGARWGVRAWACRGVRWLEVEARAGEEGPVRAGVGRDLVAGVYNVLEGGNGREAGVRGAGAVRVARGQAEVRGPRDPASP